MAKPFHSFFAGEISGRGQGRFFRVDPHNRARSPACRIDREDSTAASVIEKTLTPQVAKQFPDKRILDPTVSLALLIHVGGKSLLSIHGAYPVVPIVSFSFCRSVVVTP